MLKIKKLFNWDKSDEQSRDAILREGIRVLKKNKYKFVANIGSGTFGDVISVKTPDRKSEVAAKIVLPEKSAFAELHLWHLFQHPNVLPLLNTLRNPKIDIFMMPLHPTDIFWLIRDKKLRAHNRKFEICRKLLKNLLDGLHYLHGLSKCHLDLKSDNVLVTADLTAVICDFSCVESTEMPVNSYCLPCYYRPPETCVCVGDGPSVKGIPFDVWSFGMLALYVMTAVDVADQTNMEKMRLHRYDGSLAKQNYFHEYVYPLLFRALQPTHFKVLMKEAFPNVSLTETVLSRTLNLIRGTLRYHPNNRPDTSRLQRHPLIAAEDEDTWELLPPDSVWIRLTDANGKPLNRCPSRKSERIPVVYLAEDSPTLVPSTHPPSELYRKYVTIPTNTAVVSTDTASHCQDSRRSSDTGVLKCHPKTILRDSSITAKKLSTDDLCSRKSTRENKLNRPFLLTEKSPGEVCCTQSDTDTSRKQQWNVAKWPSDTALSEKRVKLELRLLGKIEMGSPVKPCAKHVGAGKRNRRWLRWKLNVFRGYFRRKCSHKEE